MRVHRHNDKKNVIGPNVRRLRKGQWITQSLLAERLRAKGYDFERIAISRIEGGTRIVMDYEVMALAEVFGVELEELYADYEADDDTE